jgi:hypothetical protein
MKQNQIILIVIGFLMVVLMATNPSTAEHKEAVKEKVSSAFENNNTDVNAFQKLGEQLGQTIGMVIIDKMIKRENYLLFSLTKSRFLDNDEKEKVVGLGILGKVYLSNEFSEKVTEKIEETSNPIIGNTIKIENIEIAEKDFPEKMNWKDAKKACEKLGEGWRLPTKDELKLICQNKNANEFNIKDSYPYWSSTKNGEDIEGTPFYSIITFDSNCSSNSSPRDGYSFDLNNVRAIRSN